MSPKLYDVLIIGGGPAGLSAATTIARQLHTALVIDSGVYRNARAAHVHSFPGFDHVSPADFRNKIKQDLKDRYESIEFKSAVVKSVRKLEHGGFEATDDKGDVYLGRKLVLGTGMRDVVEEEAEGYDECWVRAIFHCLFCHGYEERGCESVGLLATGAITAPMLASRLALMAKQFTKHVTVYTNGDESLQSSIKALILSTDISYNNAHITKYTLQQPSNPSSPPSILLNFSDGTSRVESFVAGQPRLEQASPFAAQLGLDLTPTGEIVVQGFGNDTSLAGCYAAGDAATAMKNMLQAVHMGGFVGAGVVMGLQSELDAKGET